MGIFVCGALEIPKSYAKRPIIPVEPASLMLVLRKIGNLPRRNIDAFVLLSGRIPVFTDRANGAQSNR